MPPRRKLPKPTPGAVVVPPMKPCPACGLDLEEGTGPHGLAWHGCEPKASSADLVIAEVLTQMQTMAREAPVKDLVMLLAAVAEYKNAAPGGEAPKEIQDWLARRES